MYIHLSNIYHFVSEEFESSKICHMTIPIWNSEKWAHEYLYPTLTIFIYPSVASITLSCYDDLAEYIYIVSVNTLETPHGLHRGSMESMEAPGVLYHFDRVFSHGSQMTLNWTLEVFRDGSRRSVNIIFRSLSLKIFTCQEFSPRKWVYRASVTPNFRLWTVAGSVHEGHTSHPVNTRSKWYSSPWRLQAQSINSSWTLYGLFQEYAEYTRSTPGVYQEYTRRLHGLPGLHRDSWWSPPGSVGECNIQPSSNEIRLASHYSNLLSYSGKPFRLGVRK
jgi:hypothetical protein